MMKNSRGPKTVGNGGHARPQMRINKSIVGRLFKYIGKYKFVLFCVIV